jgi:hypothetical protein
VRVPAETQQPADWQLRRRLKKVRILPWCKRIGAVTLVSACWSPVLPPMVAEFVKRRCRGFHCHVYWKTCLSGMKRCPSNVKLSLWRRTYTTREVNKQLLHFQNQPHNTVSPLQQAAQCMLVTTLMETCVCWAWAGDRQPSCDVTWQRGSSRQRQQFRAQHRAGGVGTRLASHCHEQFCVPCSIFLLILCHKEATRLLRTGRWLHPSPHRTPSRTPTQYGFLAHQNECH